jgi:hypothetical protein
MTPKSIWERVDTALTVTLKLLVLGAFVFGILSLSFCSDRSVKETAAWTLGRLELAGFRPTKLSLGVIELQSAAAAATGVEAGNAKGIAQDLARLAKASGNKDIELELGKIAEQIGTYSERLEARDYKLIDVVRTASQSVKPEVGPIFGWLFLGRRSATGDWAPSSEKIQMTTPHEPKTVTIKKDTVLVERDPARESPDGSKRSDSQQLFRLVRAGGKPLNVISLSEAESIGNAKLVWARVEVEPVDLYEARP